MPIFRRGPKDGTHDDQRSAGLLPVSGGDVDEMALRDWLSQAPEDACHGVVAGLVSIVRPFGVLAPAVVTNVRFQELADDVQNGLRTGPSETLTEALVELEATPALSEDEEPDGVAFFTLGAVVELIYATRFVLGTREAGVHALARASDVIGFADDELGTNVREELLRWVAGVATGSARPDQVSEVVHSVEEQGRRLAGA